jgi:hypothetical protein
MITGSLNKFDNVGAFTEALWRPTPDLFIRPGVRVDALLVTPRHSAARR